MTERLIELEPEAVASLLSRDEIILVDVREPYEFASGHIEGAVLLPLSVFDPADLPDPEGRTLVFQCASGMRSATAVRASQAAGLPFSHHLKGGINAWRAAALPVLRD